MTNQSTLMQVLFSHLEFSHSLDRKLPVAPHNLISASDPEQTFLAKYRWPLYLVELIVLRCDGAVRHFGFVSRRLIAFVVFNLVFLTNASATFSIAAVDVKSGEIGSAGATCLDSIMLDGEEGALVISDIILKRGVIHTQAWWNSQNQDAARDRIKMGQSPEEVIRWLRTHDVDLDEKSIGNRQYGIVDINKGEPRVSAFTGEKNEIVAAHLTGPDYSIQGNTLVSGEVLEDMEQAFLTTSGKLADRLMAAMEAAKQVGADSRCAKHGVSSLSAFIRVAREADTDPSYGKLNLDINVSSTPDGIDPIDVLKDNYEEWRGRTASAN